MCIGGHGQPVVAPGQRGSGRIALNAHRLAWRNVIHPQGDDVLQISQARHLGNAANAIVINQGDPAVIGAVRADSFVGIKVSVLAAARDKPFAAREFQHMLHMIGTRSIHTFDRNLVLVRCQQQLAVGEWGIRPPAQGSVDPGQMVLDTLQRVSDIAFDVPVDDFKFAAKHIRRQVLNVHAPEPLRGHRRHLFDQQLLTGDAGVGGADDQSLLVLEQGDERAGGAGIRRQHGHVGATRARG